MRQMAILICASVNKIDPMGIIINTALPGTVVNKSSSQHVAPYSRNFGSRRAACDTDASGATCGC